VFGVRLGPLFNEFFGVIEFGPVHRNPLETWTLCVFTVHSPGWGSGQS
jgi:hypothetical protein